MMIKEACARSFPRLFNQLALAKNRLQFAGQDSRQIFVTIFKKNFWRGSHSRSGAGSDLLQTRAIRKRLPQLVEELGIASLLDVPCGDLYWMSTVQLPVQCYVGVDIVEQLITLNRQKFGNEQRSFLVGDVRSDPLPRSDMVFCRDCFVHFSHADIERALSNIGATGARFLLTTTFTGRQANSDIRTGLWRPINLEKPPFNLPPPLQIINEECTEGAGAYGDKSLGLWHLPL